MAAIVETEIVDFGTADGRFPRSRHVLFRAGSEEKTHAVHPPVQQAGQTREMEVLRCIASDYSRFNRYSPLVPPSVNGRRSVLTTAAAIVRSDFPARACMHGVAWRDAEPLSILERECRDAAESERRSYLGNRC
jgi:hypothetical protein